MPAAQFKARCLEVMTQVERTRRPVIITRRGRPVARLVPVETFSEPFLGALRAQIAVLGDIAASAELSEEWETEKEWRELCRENPAR